LPNSTDDATLYLHLAKAWMAQGDRTLAEFALSMAESGQLKSQSLLPFDREMYQEVADQLRVSP
jgi:hypothetical protein